MLKENRKRKRKEKWEKGKGRGGGRVSARRRRLRGARARGGVRGMARGPGEAAARAAGNNCGPRSRMHGMGQRLGKRERESEVRSKKKRWNRRMESGVGNRVFGTKKRFRELGFRVLEGF